MQSTFMELSLTDERKTTANSTLAKGRVSSPVDSFVLAECFVLRNS